MARGDRREPIVGDDADRSRLVRTMAEVCAKTGWRVHAWVLMSNHYHWLLDTNPADECLRSEAAPRSALLRDREAQSKLLSLAGFDT